MRHDRRRGLFGARMEISGRRLGVGPNMNEVDGKRGSKLASAVLQPSFDKRQVGGCRLSSESEL